MANLMTATKFVKNEILAELKKGNTEVLKGLPPVMAMSLGMALQKEAGEAGGVKEESPINDRDVNEAMLNRMADTGIKERLIKEIEAKQELAKQITKEVTGE